MFNDLNPLQMILVGLFCLAVMLYVLGIIYIVYGMIKAFVKSQKHDITFDELHNVLSENEITYQEANKKLNDYKS